MIFFFCWFLQSGERKKKVTTRVSGKEKKNTFTCCKNTFPSLNVPRGRSQHTRWHTTVTPPFTHHMSVPGEKKCPDLCTKDGGGMSGKGGGSIMRRVLDVLGTGNTRRGATAGGYVCIWTLREKATNSIVLLLLFFFNLSDHNSIHYAPSQPHWLCPWPYRAPDWW